MDWGASPESIEKITNNTYDYVSAVELYDTNSSNGFSSGAYGGCGEVSQLGSYTNSPSAQTIQQITQNRESVLNTLINGSQMKDNIARCAELITVDKKKGIKVE
jgi:phage I-like protein